MANVRYSVQGVQNEIRIGGSPKLSVVKCRIDLVTLKSIITYLPMVNITDQHFCLGNSTQGFEFLSLRYMVQFWL